MRSWLGIGLIALCMVAAQAEPGPLRVGVLPYLSPRTLLIEFAPLREFLESELQRKVEILTAPDFPRFLARTDAGDFDLVITAPHFARLAQTAHGFRPLIAIRADFYALIVVPKNSAAQTLRGLHGKTLHLPHRVSFITIQIEEFLRQRGIQPERDLTLLYYNTDNNAILAAERSQDDAAAAQRTVFERMPKEITDKLRILGSTQSALSLIVLAPPNLPNIDGQRLQLALDKFPYSVEGLKFLEASHAEFMPVTAGMMQQLDAYLPKLKTQLEEKR